MKVQSLSIALASVLVSCVEPSEARNACKSKRGGQRSGGGSGGTRRRCSPTRRPRQGTARPVPRIPATATPTRFPTAAPTFVCSAAQSYGNQLYAAIPGSYTWDQANASAATFTCCGGPGRLAIINDGNKNDFLRLNLGGVVGWIGLTDKANEGTFVWVDQQTPPIYTNWNAGEPNDFGGGEDCVAINGTAGGWNDVPCNSVSIGAFIIEFQCD